MEVAKENLSGTFVELDIGSSTESFQKFLELQKELFHSQIDQLHNVVVMQCRLTGVNPLSQEMAAGALSIKIGKRPRDLLNPKAVKYMQSVFSIKDTISKKESREISALCGVTVSQVREFFANQRSRVRKLVRLSREKVIRSNACNASQDWCPTSSDPAMPIDQVPLNSVDPNTVEQASPCSTHEETIPGNVIDDPDRTFLENIFSLLKKEETFSGQVKLMEWIMKIQSASVLNWFLTKGGLMILATWLSQAVLEEQTTALLVILKVLCHLPLHKALPAQMSAILQTVNRLRFYRTSGVEPRIGEILSGESWQSKVDIPKEILSLTYESSEIFWKSEYPQTLKLLPASTDDTNRKRIRSVSSTQTRERRKVLLVEQPGQKTAGRSLQVARVVPANQGRPMSADDIQKAKMRAMFMQSKYGKTGSSSNERCQQKTEVLNKIFTSQTSNLLPLSKTLVMPKNQEDMKFVVLASKTSPTPPEAPLDPKRSSETQEPSWEKLKRDQIRWQMPPEVRINSLRRVGAGEKSKEVEVQIGRIRREKEETIYQSIQDIPSDPKEPWDLEMDYDDTLTPEIPTEQQPDADGAETLSSPCNNEKITDTSVATPIPAQISNGSALEPDLELLAVLLKNPELVFALTSGQGGSLTSVETVRLLDMIKGSVTGLPGILNGLAGKAEVEATSLASPTPSTNPLMVCNLNGGWRSEFAKDSFSQPVATDNRDATAFLAVSATSLVPPQTPTTNFVLPRMPAIATPGQLPAELYPHLSPKPKKAAVFPEKQLQAAILSLHQNPSTISLLQQTPLTEAVFPVKHSQVTSSYLQSFPAVDTQRFGQNNIKPAAVSIVLNPPERPPITLPLLPIPPRLQPPLLPEPLVFTPLYPTWPQNAARSGNHAPESDSRSGYRNSNSRSQANQNNYNVYQGGPVQSPLLPGPPWERSKYMDEPEFENWSPERSPIGSPENRSGRNFPEQRRDSGRNSRHDWSRQRNSGYRDHSRHGNGRWRNRRR
ncbi:hypothetical protein HHK36_012447 [Tetracentron sinense]|uniref:Homeobox domain-containing protein n=1 Tax=Tetracentron sinense TaxID=13715 RepID=A0A835DI36_TETSI|nr:hypothetical protein HHK36_012447 [Tetracentron sinense]